IEKTWPSTSNFIYVYYGNDAVSTTSSGEDTFVFFDDFEDDTIGQMPSGWTKIQGSASDTLTVINLSGSKVAKLHEARSSVNGVFRSSTYNGSDGYVVHYKYRYETAGKRTIHGVHDLNNNIVWNLLSRDDKSDWRARVDQWRTLSSWGNPSADTWYRLEGFSRDTDNKVKFYKNRANSEGWYTPYSGSEARKFYFRGKDTMATDAYFDDMYVRKYEIGSTGHEPVVYLVGPELSYS
ncbi:DUF2341 domain-containing protein, partial [Candidatus Bathyarchaeota archaeon]|nr:DUF2341 domain-containing protein [Candidatus Bathyarchaeota archaeon]